MRNRRFFLVLVGLAASWPGSSGCGGGAITPQLCTTSAECPNGYGCQEGICTPLGDGSVVKSDAPGWDGWQAEGSGPCTGGTAACGTSKVCCKSGETCLYGECIEKQSCQNDTQCMNDTYCDNGQCIPWGKGPKGDKNSACTYLVPIGLFSPARQCSWTGPPSGDKYPTHKNVLGTPLVADFNFDNNSKVREPSIIFVSYNYEDGGGEASYCASGYHGVIRVLDGKTCKQLHTVDMDKVRASSPLAVGDLDLDGRPDIVAMRCGGGLSAFEYDSTSAGFKLLWTAASTIGATSDGWAGPSIHDLDDDGKPEILMGGSVFSHDGTLIDGTLGMLSYSAGFIPVAADLDGDKVVELVNGASVWQYKAKKWTLLLTSATNTPGQVAVADLGNFGSNPQNDDRGKLDGLAEIIVISSGTVRAQTIAGRVVFGPYTIPGGGTGGPPTVGDFDADGRAEIAAASMDSYSVFDPDCAGTPQKATCDSLTKTGILWTRTSQDYSSNVTGSSIFDFDGDGAAEAVYSDECFTRVYDGKSGEVLYSQWRTSCTWYENPIVADVDGDFNSELVVPSNTNCTIDTTCMSNTKHDKHPTSGLTLDPLYKGLRCKLQSDCPGGTCGSGFCRCTADKDCGTDGGLVCGPAVSGTTGAGNVCRAAFKGDLGGILVYRDILDRWVNSRVIWNQHAYSVTNINEDGTVPKTSAWVQNWKQTGLNNFRQNKQGSLDPTSSPDLTAGKPAAGQGGFEPGKGFPCDKMGTMKLQAKLCNRGTQAVAAGLPVTFYNGIPAGKQGICTTKSAAQIDPGKCETVGCEWKGAPVNNPTDVYVVADDDGTGKGTENECQEGNNQAVLKGVICTDIQ